MRYIVTRKYYLNLLTELRKFNRHAGHKDVIDYFNKMSGIRNGVKYVEFYD